MTVHRISVVCQDSRHPKKTVKLLRFESYVSGRQPDDEEMVWTAMRNISRSSVPGRNQASTGFDDYWKRALDPDFMANPSKHSDGEFGIKTVFACGLCGENFAASDRDRLHAVLTKFWENNLTEIPLKALRSAYSR